MARKKIRVKLIAVLILKAGLNLRDATGQDTDGERFLDWGPPCYPRGTLRSPIPTGLFVFSAALLLFSCTLRTMPPPVRIQITRAARDNPALSAMRYFAVAVSGPVGNTLSAAQLAGRNVECLKLSGQVFFPFSLVQLQS